MCVKKWRTWVLFWLQVSEIFQLTQHGWRNDYAMLRPNGILWYGYKLWRRSLDYVRVSKLDVSLKMGPFPNPRRTPPGKNHPSRPPTALTPRDWDVDPNLQSAGGGGAQPRGRPRWKPLYGCILMSVCQQEQEGQTARAAQWEGEQLGSSAWEEEAVVASAQLLFSCPAHPAGVINRAVSSRKPCSLTQRLAVRSFI